MIIEGKKITAFDLLEAAIKLSDLYNKNNAQKGIIVEFFGETKCFYIYFFDDTKKKNNKITQSFRIYLDKAEYGDKFEQAFEKIEKEMEQYE